MNHECHMVVGRTNGGYYFPITSKYTESDIQKLFLKVDTPGKSAEATTEPKTNEPQKSTEGNSTPNTPDTDVEVNISKNIRYSINSYQSKEGERAGKFNRMQKFVGQQTNNGWFRAKIKKSFFGPFPLPSPLQRRK